MSDVMPSPSSAFPGKGLSPSRFALYEGFVALAWADHVLTEEEQDLLHVLIDRNVYATAAQKDTLHEIVSTPVAMSDVWPRITDAQDRARLIDMAQELFVADGVKCETEAAMADQLAAWHLADVNAPAVLRELADHAKVCPQEREAEREAMRAYRRRFSLVGYAERLFSAGD